MTIAPFTKLEAYDLAKKYHDTMKLKSYVDSLGFIHKAWSVMPVPYSQELQSVIRGLYNDYFESKNEKNIEQVKSIIRNYKGEEYDVILITSYQLSTGIIKPFFTPLQLISKGKDLLQGFDLLEVE